MSFKIKEIDLTYGTVVVDWGWIMLNHNLPIDILENPHMDPTEMRRLIGMMEPEKPKERPLTAELRALIDTDNDGEISQEEWNEAPDELTDGVQKPDYTDEPKTQDAAREF